MARQSSKTIDWTAVAWSVRRNLIHCIAGSGPQAPVLSSVPSAEEVSSPSLLVQESVRHLCLCLTRCKSGTTKLNLDAATLQGCKRSQGGHVAGKITESFIVYKQFNAGCHMENGEQPFPPLIYSKINTANTRWYLWGPKRAHFPKLYDQSG